MFVDVIFDFLANFTAHTTYFILKSFGITYNLSVKYPLQVEISSAYNLFNDLEKVKLILHVAIW